MPEPWQASSLIEHISAENKSQVLPEVVLGALLEDFEHFVGPLGSKTGPKSTKMPPNLTSRTLFEALLECIYIYILFFLVDFGVHGYIFGDLLKGPVGRCFRDGSVGYFELIYTALGPYKLMRLSSGLPLFDNDPWTKSTQKCFH